MKSLIFDISIILGSGRSLFLHQESDDIEKIVILKAQLSVISQRHTKKHSMVHARGSSHEAVFKHALDIY